MNTAVFGYSFFGVPFKEVIRVISDGLIVAGKQLRWSDIVAFRAFPDFYQDLAYLALKSAKPRLRLYLRDGSIITVRGDLLVREGDMMRREHGIPEAFPQLVGEIRRAGIPKWEGPREEITLFGTAWLLFLTGCLIGSVAAVLFGISASIIGVAIVSGVLLAQLAFLVAPLLSRRFRLAFIAARPARGSAGESSGTETREGVSPTR